MKTAFTDQRRTSFCTSWYKMIQEAQLPQRNSASAAHMEVAKPSSPLPIPLWLHLDAYGRIRNPQQTYAKRAVRKAD